MRISELVSLLGNYRVRLGDVDVRWGDEFRGIQCASPVLYAQEGRLSGFEEPSVVLMARKPNDPKLSDRSPEARS